MCKDNITMTDESSTSVHLAVSPARGWKSYLQVGRGGASPPFGATCPLTVVTRRGQRLNVTVVSMGQYGALDVDFAASSAASVNVVY